MFTVLAGVSPSAEPEVHQLVVYLGMGPEGAGLWKRGGAWEQGKPIPGCGVELATARGHCSLDLTGPPEKL